MRLVDRRRLQKIQFRCLSRSVALANRDNFPVISGFNLRSYFWFVQGIAALGKFFFAISGLSDCHRFDLAATWQVYFSLEERSLTKRRNSTEIEGFAMTSVHLPRQFPSHTSLLSTTPDAHGRSFRRWWCEDDRSCLYLHGTQSFLQPNASLHPPRLASRTQRVKLIRSVCNGIVRRALYLSTFLN